MLPTTAAAGGGRARRPMPPVFAGLLSVAERVPWPCMAAVAVATLLATLAATPEWLAERSPLVGLLARWDAKTSLFWVLALDPLYAVLHFFVVDLTTPAGVVTFVLNMFVLSRMERRFRDFYYGFVYPKHKPNRIIEQRAARAPDAERVQGLVRLYMMFAFVAVVVLIVVACRLLLAVVFYTAASRWFPRMFFSSAVHQWNSGFTPVLLAVFFFEFASVFWMRFVKQPVYLMMQRSGAEELPAPGILGILLDFVLFGVHYLFADVFWWNVGALLAGIVTGALFCYYYRVIVWRRIEDHDEAELHLSRAATVEYAQVNRKIFVVFLWNITVFSLIVFGVHAAYQIAWDPSRLGWRATNANAYAEPMLARMRALATDPESIAARYAGSGLTPPPSPTHLLTVVVLPSADMRADVSLASFVPFVHSTKSSGAAAAGAGAAAATHPQDDDDADTAAAGAAAAATHPQDDDDADTAAAAAAAAAAADAESTLRTGINMMRVRGGDASDEDDAYRVYDPSDLLNDRVRVVVLPWATHMPRFEEWSQHPEVDVSMAGAGSLDSSQLSAVLAKVQELYPSMYYMLLDAQYAFCGHRGWLSTWRFLDYLHKSSESACGAIVSDGTGAIVVSHEAMPRVVESLGAVGDAMNATSAVMYCLQGVTPLRGARTCRPCRHEFFAASTLLARNVVTQDVSRCGTRSEYDGRRGVVSIDAS